MGRIPEIDHIKALAIMFIFFEHTTWSALHIQLKELAFNFYIGSLFFVSGYLMVQSLGNQRKFWNSRFRHIYLPYMGMVTFASITNLWLPQSVGSWMLCLTPLPIFQNLKPVMFGAFWFIPVLISYFIIFAFLDKFVISSKAKIIVIAAMWVAETCGEIYFSPLRVLETWVIFLPVFAAGYFYRKGKIPSMLTQIKVLVPSFLLGALNMCPFIANATIRYFYNYSRICVFVVAITVLLLRLFKNVPTNRAIIVVSSSTLMIYLTEPYISTLVSYLLYGSMDYYAVETVLFEVLRVPLVLIFGVLMQKLVDRFV